jgi:hypothetical protein
MSFLPSISSLTYSSWKQYTRQEQIIVHETPDLYNIHVKPYIDAFPPSRTKWRVPYLFVSIIQLQGSLQGWEHIDGFLWTEQNFVLMSRLCYPSRYEVGSGDGFIPLLGCPCKGPLDKESSRLTLSSPWHSEGYPTRSLPCRHRKVGIATRLSEDVYSLSTELLCAFPCFLSHTNFHESVL